MKREMGRRCVLALLASLLAWSIAGCASIGGGADGRPAQLTLAPAKLFEGEQAKLKPFVGQMAAAFKLRYDGEKPDAHLDVELWENGKKTSSLGSIGDLFIALDDKEEREVELVFAIDPLTVGESSRMTVKASVSREGGYSFVPFTLPWDESFMARGEIGSGGTRTFAAEGVVPVWGMQAASGNELRAVDLSPESLARLERAILLTLRFGE